MLKVKAQPSTAAWISEGKGYEFNVDKVGNELPFGWIKASGETEGDGILKLRLCANAFCGKRVKLVGTCRSEGVEIYAGLLVRTEKLNGRPLTEDDMLDRPLVGTNGFKRFELVIDVPAEATAIAIGARLRGKGKIWFKELRIEEVDSSVPTTDQYAYGCVGIWDLEPTNLDFTVDELPSLREKRPYISIARRWIISWEYNGPAYEMIRPTDVTFEGAPTACLRPVGEPDCGYLYQHFAAAKYRGKRVRYTLYLKTNDAKDGASLFADMYDTDSNKLLMVMKQNPVVGTNDWTRRDIEFDVPTEAYVISIGAVLQGPGEAYIGGLKFGEIRPTKKRRRPSLKSY